MMDVALSIIIPVYNEEVNVDPLLARIAAVLPGLPAPNEVIIVDDGSRDATVARLRAAKKNYPWLKIVELRRNFGQHAATYAGFDLAKGAVVVTLDGDLQNDPADIAKLLEKMKEGYEIVCGWRSDRKDPFFSRKLPSLIVNRLIRSDAPTPIHDYGCFLRAYTNEAAKELSKYSTSRGWFPVLFAKLGFRVGEVAVSHHERPGGEQSKHGFFRRMDQFMSVFLGARAKPFQFVQVVGAAGLGLGGFGVVAALAWAAAGGGSRSLMLGVGAIALSLWGFLTVVVGMIGEYLVGMNYEIGRHPKYLVRAIHE
ncbi:MAG TPA: glycosyltransferase family 2 protein [Verrucomicrobiae bacterium]|nr:glycosyltransferase family 2 protein [Verrucomicrobiae bacterium]